MYWTSSGLSCILSLLIVSRIDFFLVFVYRVLVEYFISNVDLLCSEKIDSIYEVVYA